VIAADVMTEHVTTVQPQQTVYEALNELRRGGHNALPVVSREPPGRWLGMLTRERILEAIHRDLEETQQAVLQEHGGLAAIGTEGQLQELAAGLAPRRRPEMQRLLVPLQAVGLSLRQADFRRNFGAQVIAIEQPDGTLQCPPDIDTPLRTDQRLVALVSNVEEHVGESAEQTE